jgi:hypothetical protein
VCEGVRVHARCVRVFVCVCLCVWSRARVCARERKRTPGLAVSCAVVLWVSLPCVSSQDARTHAMGRVLPATDVVVTATVGLPPRHEPRGTHSHTTRNVAFAVSVTVWMDVETVVVSAPGQLCRLGATCTGCCFACGAIESAAAGGRARSRAPTSNAPT